MERDSEYIQRLVKMAERTMATYEEEKKAIATLEAFGSVEAMHSLFHLGLEGTIRPSNKVIALDAAIRLRSRYIETGRYEDSSAVKGLIDDELYTRCAGKDYHDVANNAFPILEDKIRNILNVGREMHGLHLIDHALNPENGKLSIGATKPEKEGIYLLFRGAVSFLRNPPSHTMEVAMGEMEAHDLMCFVDLLLKFLDKAEKAS